MVKRNIISTFLGISLKQVLHLQTSLLRSLTCALHKKGRNMSDESGPTFLKIKETNLNMSLEERRKTYIGEVTTLDDIDTWDAYFNKNADRLKTLNKNAYKSSFKVNDYEAKSDLCKKVSIWRGDITKLEVDAIVNAANNSLLGGGGVDGAIHRAAGKNLLAECKTLNGCPTGEAKIAGGYELPAKYVILTVGPQGEKPGLLESCYKESLKRLLENNLRSVAFPCISTGVYGYPQDSAANVALTTVRNFLETNSSKIDRIIFCLFMPEDVKIYETAMQLFFPTE